MSRRNARIARLVSGVAVVAAVGGVAVVGSFPADPSPVEATGSVVHVPPTATTLVCPGPLVLPDDSRTGDAAFDPTPVGTVTAQRVVTTAASDAVAAAPATLSPLAGGPALLELSGPGAGPGAVAARVGGVADVDGPTLLRAEPVGPVAAPAGGASASVTTQGDLRGLAAGSCQQPSASIWLVGGSTEIGSSALLVVANPGRTPAEVSLEVWGPSGPVEAVGGGTFLVAPGAERAVLLEGIAAEQRRVTVHVTAAGGLVSAHVQDNRLDGFTPAGTDLVTAGAAPATRQVVGGIVVPASETGAPDTAQVRLLAPGDERAVVELTLLGPDGPVSLPGAERLNLGPGEVTDVSLAGLPAGSYTAVVEASTPVVAGAMITRQGPPVELDDIPTLERAWVPSGAVGAGGVVAVPDGVTGTVVVGSVAPPGADADGDGAPPAGGVLRALDAAGRVLTERTLRVPVGSTLRVDAADLGAGAPVAAVELVPDAPAAEDDAPDDAADDAPDDAPDDAADEAPDDAPASLAWWVLATTGGGPDELLSVLAPVPAPQAPPAVRVHRAERLGLP